MGNLNTHTVSSLYETFPAAEAFAPAQRLKIHYTPKHGSRLTTAEIALSALTIQCLARRIESVETLNRELSFWQQARNKKTKQVKWPFPLRMPALNFMLYILSFRLIKILGQHIVFNKEGGSAPPGYYRAIPPSPSPATQVLGIPPSAGADIFCCSPPQRPHFSQPHARA